LVTHYADLDTYEDDLPANGSPSWAIEADLPWPNGHDHDGFLKSRLATQQLCLEIASGSSAKRPREWRKSSHGGANVLLPGSLRERGEFCFVDLALVPTSTTGGGGTSMSTSNYHHGQDTDGVHDTKTKFCWKVTNVDWHELP
jgi:hypothetical protein